MFETGADGPTSGTDSDLGQLVGEWARDSRFGSRLNAADAAWLVMDGCADRILLTSPRAQELRDAIRIDEQGGIAPAIRLAEQLSPRRLPLDRPALVKVRFDARRLGAPTTCTVLRTKDRGGRNVLILALADRVPPLRAPSRKPPPAESAPAAAAIPPAGEDKPAVSPRIVWRSDAQDRLTEVSGPAAGTVRPALIDRTWAALSQARTLLDAEGLLSALAERRTFRAITVTLRLDESPEAVDLDISGTPVQRAALGFRGFNGFAMVRPTTAVSPLEPAHTHEPEGRVSQAQEEMRAATSSSDAHQETDATAASLPVVEPWAALPITPETPAGPSDDRLALVPEASEAWGSGEELSIEPESPDLPDGGSVPFTDPHLSSNEHAAFREIARALGARFAGDGDPAGPEIQAEQRDDRTAGGSVMPFPTPAARMSETEAASSAVQATLERLPGGVLVYRGDSVLFANRHFLAMAGFEDLSGLAAWGGVARLFGGITPHTRRADGAPAILTHATAASLSVDLQNSDLDWRGAPATLLLVRDASDTETARERTALQIADAFAGARAADAQAVLDSLDDGIVTLDRNARIIGLNRGAAALFGLDPREIVGAGILSLFAAESAVDVLASVHGVALEETGSLQPLPHVIGRTATGAAPLAIRVAPLPGRSDGRMSVTIRDGRTARNAATDAMDARRAAEYASARKSDFLAKISHEIRTPMNGILGFADLMLGESFGPLGHERYRDYLGDIHASGTHILSLVNDLLDLAKIEAGRLDLTFAEVPLNDVVSHCVALLQPQAMRDRIVVRTSFSGDLSPLVADERSVRQATLNVIANAIEFTEAGGQVIVSTTMADRGEIALRVRDTGIGMTEDEVETALEPFRRISVPSPRRSRGAGRNAGTGLGLPLTKALVEANHGRFRIESRKDEGTLVEMLFPPHAVSLTA